MKTFATTLKRHRRRLKMSPREIAELLRVSRPTVSNWESRKTEPNAIAQRAYLSTLEQIR